MLRGRKRTKGTSKTIFPMRRRGWFLAAVRRRARLRHEAYCHHYLRGLPGRTPRRQFRCLSRIPLRRMHDLWEPVLGEGVIW